MNIKNVAVPASDTPQVYHISLLYKRVLSDGTFQKFVDVLSVNLGFSRLLMYTLMYTHELCVLQDGCILSIVLVGVCQ